jgi:hypothetical protein
VRLGVRHRVPALSLTALLALAGCTWNDPQAASTTALVQTPCGRGTVSAHATRVRRLSPIETMAAALLAFTIRIDSTRATHPRCIVPNAIVHATIQLHLGDKIEYVANRSPSVSGRPTPLSRIVSISSKPLPAGPGRPPTSHVLVSLTAIRPGQATVRYTNCSGTGC